MKCNCEVWTPDTNKQFAYAHVKRDGHFMRVIKEATGRVSYWSSLPKQLFGMEFLQAHSLITQLPPNSILLGELWLPGSRSEAIKTAINDRSQDLRFDIFACERLGGINLSADMSLAKVHALISDYGLGFIPFYRINCIKEQRELLELDLPIDCEGYVFKNGNLLDWYKAKKRKTIDLIIKGFTQGEGKYLNQIGAIVVESSERYELANVSGMADHQRRYLSEHCDELIGAVVEVEYQNVGARGRLRHPSFIRLRDDKDSAKCTVAQDADLRRIWAEPPMFKLFKEKDSYE